ncbi:MAG: O-antigen ligase family protein [Dokdonella sp.]|uniref:O-antigen ligase family protein n=1 Tax=Dokdonella sp. TaxID=2291710 RepID=UPI0032657C0A
MPWSALLVLAVLVLLPVGRAAEVPWAIGGIVAIVLLLRRRLELRDQDLRLAMTLFACYWLPALFSAVHAIDPGKTGSTVAITMRFLPFALFSLWALRDASVWNAVTGAIAAVVSLWALDAYVQMATGYSIGGPAEAERVSGIFGAGNLKLGPTLSVLSPFVLVAARMRFGWKGLALAFVLLAPPILLAGSRAAWVSYALIGVVIAWQETRRPLRFIAVIVSFALVVGAIGALALHDSARFGARVERSLLALRGTDAALDDASAGRLSIWRTAIAMNRANPLTGVGVRGFRYAYPTYAAPGDRFVDPKTETGASHAHQIVLEVLSETGVVGLAFWLIGTWLGLRAWWRADGAARSRALAPALALVAMCFPVNTHLAFYSAWWGLLFWWLLALYCAALAAHGTPADRSA